MPAIETRYKVIDGVTLRTGTARDLLEAIRAEGATRNDELRKMTTEQYH